MLSACLPFSRRGIDNAPTTELRPSGSLANHNGSRYRSDTSLPARRVISLSSESFGNRVVVVAILRRVHHRRVVVAPDFHSDGLAGYSSWKRIWHENTRQTFSRRVWMENSGTKMAEGNALRNLVFTRYSACFRFSRRDVTNYGVVVMC